MLIGCIDRFSGSGGGGCGDSSISRPDNDELNKQ